MKHLLLQLLPPVLPQPVSAGKESHANPFQLSTLRQEKTRRGPIQPGFNLSGTRNNVSDTIRCTNVFGVVKIIDL